VGRKSLTCDKKGEGNVDPVPTRSERLAASGALLAALLIVPAAVLGSGVIGVVLLFVALTCGTIRTPASGTANCWRSAPNGPRGRPRRRTVSRVPATNGSKPSSQSSNDPRLDRVLAIGLAVLGIGALAAVATGATEELRVLLVALFGLTAALIAYAASSMNTDD
jgi:hypothetical protein